MVPDPRKTVRAAELRYLNQPQPVLVEVDGEGMPVAVGADGKGQRAKGRGQRAKVRDHWRVDEGWWREAICRLYYEVELEGGEVVTIYRDGTSGRWYRQRYG